MSTFDPNRYQPSQDDEQPPTYGQPASGTPPQPHANSGHPPQQPHVPQAIPLDQLNQPSQNTTPRPFPAQPQPVHPQQPQPIQPQPIQPQPIQPQQPQPVQPQPYQQPPQAQPQQPRPLRPVPVTPGSPTSGGPSGAPSSGQAPGAAPQARPVPLSASPGAASGQGVPATSAATGGSRPIPAASPTGARRPVPLNSAAADELRLLEADADEDDPEEGDPAAEAVRNAPPWLVSLVVHMIALIVLGLITLSLSGDKNVELEVTYAEDIGEQLLDDSLDMLATQEFEVTEPMLSEDLTEVNDPLAAPPDVPVVFDGNKMTVDMDAPTIGMALTGREKGAKRALLAAYGGTATTEAAVQRGLEWLKRNQLDDGSWSLSGPFTNGGLNENRAAATAMALLAFQGAGNTHLSGEHKDVVTRGLRALIKMMDKDGNFVHGVPHHHTLYSQAQATIVVCEIYGMTQDSQFRDPAQKALDYAAKIQAQEGGWRYSPQTDSDTSVTGWFVMALQSGKMAGLNVQSPTLDRVSKYLDRAAVDQGARYAYQPGGGDKLSMTAEGLLCRQYLGWAHSDERLRRGIEYVNRNLIDFDKMDVYYWYYATQATHHMGGDYWDTWNNVMRQAIPENQIMTGKEKGSWSPGNDQWGHQGGRLYTTCLCIYMLEVYYRHLPIYKKYDF